jgi:hypothetical protein
MKLDNIYLNKDLAKKSRKMMFVFWQCRPEKLIHPLTLNKDSAWSSLISFINSCPYFQARAEILNKIIISSLI